MNKDELTKLWLDSSILKADIAKRLGITENMLRTMARYYKLPPRKQAAIPTHGVSRERFEEVWMDFSKTKSEASFILGIPKATCADLARHYGLPPGRGGRISNNNVVDPTPEEIEARCAEIQSRWSDEERAAREGHRSPELAAFSYEGPMVGFRQQSVV